MTTAISLLKTSNHEEWNIFLFMLLVEMYLNAGGAAAGSFSTTENQSTLTNLRTVALGNHERLFNSETVYRF